MTALPRRATWQVHVWASVLPALALVFMVAFVLRGRTRGPVAAAAGLGLGTLLLPFATDYFAHVLSACLASAGFALLFVERLTPARLMLLAAAGVAAGLAIVVGRASRGLGCGDDRRDGGRADARGLRHP